MTEHHTSQTLMLEKMNSSLFLVKLLRTVLVGSELLVVKKTYFKMITWVSDSPKGCYHCFLSFYRLNV